jgi:hypothetical protein
MEVSVACHPGGGWCLSPCLTLDMHCCQWFSWQQCIIFFTLSSFIAFFHLTPHTTVAVANSWFLIANYRTDFLCDALLFIHIFYLLPGFNAWVSTLACRLCCDFLRSHFTSFCSEHRFWLSFTVYVQVVFMQVVCSGYMNAGCVQTAELRYLPLRTTEICLLIHCGQS